MAAVRSPGEIRAYQVILEQIRRLDDKVHSVAIEAFKNLGINPKDEEGRREILQILEKVRHGSARWFPSAKDPGVYFIYKIDGGPKDIERTSLGIKTSLERGNPSERMEPVAVFKVGSKRANIEIFVRDIATKLGLEDVACTGIFYAQQKPDLSLWQQEDKQLSEDLWSGATKFYIDQDLRDDAHVVGILEPFIKQLSPQAELRRSQYLKITVFALAIGLRDAHSDNVLSKLIDVEECMPVRLDPGARESATPATHLPFLADPICEECIGETAFTYLKELVSKWSVDLICDEISQMSISFPDVVMESEDSFASDHEYLDENHIRVTGDFETEPDDLFEKRPLDGKNLIFSHHQIGTLKIRLERLKSIILTKINPETTLRDIVALFDPFYARCVKVITTVQKASRERTISEGRPSALVRTVSSEEPYNLAGRSSASPLIFRTSPEKFEKNLGRLSYGNFAEILEAMFS